MPKDVVHAQNVILEMSGQSSPALDKDDVEFPSDRVWRFALMTDPRSAAQGRELAPLADDVSMEFATSFIPAERLIAGLLPARRIPGASNNVICQVAAKVGRVADAPGGMPCDLTVLNRNFIPDTRCVLQHVTDRAVEELAVNPGIARDLMSAGSYRHLVKRTSLAGASFGKAVERLADHIIAEDEVLSSILSYQSRPFKSTPDFFGYEGYNLRLLEITTSNEIPKHLTRPYGPAVDYIIHSGLPDNLVFPQ
jgi:hypothetical protein